MCTENNCNFIFEATDGINVGIHQIYDNSETLLSSSLVQINLSTMINTKIVKFHSCLKLYSLGLQKYIYIHVGKSLVNQVCYAKVT